MAEKIKTRNGYVYQGEDGKFRSPKKGKNTEQARINAIQQSQAAARQHIKSITKEIEAVESRKGNEAVKLQLQMLQQELKKARKQCSDRYAKLEHEKEIVCKDNPGKCPVKKTNIVINKEDRPAACPGEYQGGTCRTTIYNYANGNRRMVTWYKKAKEPKKPKSKGVADCGCKL